MNKRLLVIFLMVPAFIKSGCWSSARHEENRGVRTPSSPYSGHFPGGGGFFPVDNGARHASVCLAVIQETSSRPSSGDTTDKNTEHTNQVEKK